MAETPLDNENDHWADGLITDETPEAHATALRNFESQEDLNNAFLTNLDHNWREDFAKDADGQIDAKFMSSLERYENPQAFGNAFREQRATISSGGYKQPPGADATDEDIAAYREANNIPKESDGYFENLPEGLVVGEDDMEIFKDFAGAMHEMNVQPEVMHKVIDWYNNFAENEQDALAGLDNEHHTETEDQLRQEWGSDYRANINLIGSHLDSQFGEDAAQALLNARDPSGRAIMNIPGVLEGFMRSARTINPVAQIAPQENRTSRDTLDDRISEIEKFMRTNRSEYDKDEKMQAELRELYEIRIQDDNRRTGT